MSGVHFNDERVAHIDGPSADNLGVPSDFWQNDNQKKVQKKLCNDGGKCSKVGCTFIHTKINKPCRLGAQCPRGERCLFLHFVAHGGATQPTLVERDMQMWLRSKNDNGRAS